MERALAWLNRAVASLEARGEVFELMAALLARGSLFGIPGDITRGESILQQGGFLDPAVREGGGWSWR